MNLMARNKRDERMRSEGRAEVLAACIKELERLSEEARGLGFDDDSLVITNAKDKLKELQPAAKDLEELLREERLNEANAHSVAFNLAMLTHQPEKYAQWRERRLTELEKARAILEKP